MHTVLAKIAGINVEFNTLISDLSNVCKSYIVSDVKPDIIVTVTQDEVEGEKSLAPFEEDVSLEICESICAHRGLCKQIWKFDALVLHCATFAVDGRAIAFAAKSGTGKTTHMRLWKRYLGDKMIAINGDKPIIRFFDGVPYAHGTPWRGKEGFGKNMAAPLTDICFIERDTNNSVVPTTKEDALNRIFNQILLPNDPMGSVKTLQMVDDILNKCNLWIIKCNMEPEAAEVAYNQIIKNGKDKI